MAQIVVPDVLTVQGETMKILFLIDITDEQGEVTVPNGRALEILPRQLQLKQTSPCETWLAFPVDENGYNPESSSFVPLVKFPVALKRCKGRAQRRRLGGSL
jgi:hypothetical protein